MDPIIARVREIKLLEKIDQSNQPEFLALYGRRRIGKTFLIRHFFKKKGLYFELTGIKDGSLRQQLFHFNVEFSRVFGEELSSSPKTWLEAFNQLRIAIENSKIEGRIILFFDELPWLATIRSDFLSTLDHFWNRYMSDDSRIILIVCGSAASWMINKVISNKGGLHGRLTAIIRLLPFNLAETETFLKSRGIELDRKQLIDIYMAVGGVAKYLTYIERGDSSLQAISQLCFNGPLFNEFEELYSSLFDYHMHHVNIVTALAKHQSGLTKEEICNETGLTSGGGLQNILNELEASGFIIPILNFGMKKKNTRFRLTDEYSLFYLKWIVHAKSISSSQVDETYWIKIKNTPTAYAWSGYAFENICMKHISHLKSSLGISGISTNESQWTYRPKKKGEKQGTQIDLLIDRADNCINICEIKYVNGEFLITKDYAKKLMSKKELFIEKTDTKKSVLLTMITTYGVKKNEGEFGVVDFELTMNDLFK